MSDPGGPGGTGTWYLAPRYLGTEVPDRVRDLLKGWLEHTEPVWAVESDKRLYGCLFIN